MRSIDLILIAATLCSQLRLGSCGIQVPISLRSATVSRMAKQDKSRAEAVRLWEQAIAAKGGRERLYAVNNILISSRQRYTTHKGRQNEVRGETLYVLPNKYWFYDDYGSDVFGIDMHMYNYDTGQQYVGVPGDAETRLEAIDKKTKRTKLDSGQLVLLLETKSLRPIPLTAKTERIGLKKVDIVQTDVNGTRVDFAFDQKTHLPIEVRFYDVIDSKTYIEVQRLSDYIEVNGIKVPQTIKLDDGSVDRSVIQFNVAYNEGIFAKPPTKADPEPWRPKARN
jgi:hypothetical protein